MKLREIKTADDLPKADLKHGELVLKKVMIELTAFINDFKRMPGKTHGFMSKVGNDHIELYLDNPYSFPKNVRLYVEIMGSKQSNWVKRVLAILQKYDPTATWTRTGVPGIDYTASVFVH